MSVAATEPREFGTVWAQCVARAWQDPQFHEALKSDPKGTLLSSYQFTLPVGVELQVLDRDEPQQSAQANTLRMIIPPKPDVAMQEVALADAGKSPKHGGFTAC